ncbi:MAG: hypothetical protein GWN01_05740 [Nitrosopumilaceae archaeon]|nr:hypothetical protein [Nitrosopumilaceae archaeon]NIU00444.1 hypothetical protein [Nitrosopumilaceae archaeon]NIU87121.1 hypothetical protein [Nitrosopumilaceae archaeon]NIV65676.1 hypothetical protein [Nitrosopumilaceae archaeon]NIX61046.1 hypothetical protein [Nitrosopumilaceae archaeon]
MSLTCTLQISLNDISQKKLNSLERALGPDNINFPKGLSFSLENVEGKLIFNFQNHGELGKMIGTVDEILEHVQVALKVMK